MQRSMTAGALTRMVAVIACGVGVGIPTSLLQPELSAPWFSLANAASPWLTPMFFLGALWRRLRLGWECSCSSASVAGSIVGWRSGSSSAPAGVVAELVLGMVYSQVLCGSARSV